jgi:O-acetyl-ADP-ribose deacetylase (regulator of RNase III)
MSEEVLGTLAFGRRRFEVVLHDLLDERVDGIVNAANGALAHGGGVAAMIARAAGAELEAHGRRIIAMRGTLQPGEAVLTTAGKLRFKGVIHAVGPRHGQGDEEGTLVRALVSAFDIAEAQGWKSLAFPAVSSGIFGVPANVCARAYLAAAGQFFAIHPQSRLEKLRLALREGELADLFRRHFQ